MRYTVVWKPEAERRLAGLWVAGPDRQAIADAANRSDARLAVDPQNAGESRPGGRRILLEAPLGGFFKVSEPDRLVSVFAVWRFR